MTAPPVFEGTWEELLSHAQELASYRIRVYVLSEEEHYPDIPASERTSTADSLLKYMGTWIGDDLEECLQSVYDSRIKAEF